MSVHASSITGHAAQRARSPARRLYQRLTPLAIAAR